MSIKLVATDMDGTLLNNRKEMPAGFIPWVKAHPQIRTCIASGRQYYTLLDDFTEIADQLIYIAENGGFVFEHGEMIYSNPMEEDVLRQFLSLAGQIPGATPILCGARSAYMPFCPPAIEAQGHMYYHHLEFLENPASCIGQDVISKVTLYIEQQRAPQSLSFLSALPDSVHPVVSGTDWIDINNASVNKGSAIRAIQQKYGILPEECMAFGDFMNDYDLLQACGESYAMENAYPELKAVARHLAPSNEEEGVLKILLRELP